MQVLFGRFQQSANLLTQFGIVGVTVFDNSVTDGGVKYFFFRAFDTQSTAALARMVAAIDCFSICHDPSPFFPVWSSSFSLAFLKTNLKVKL